MQLTPAFAFHSQPNKTPWQRVWGEQGRLELGRLAGPGGTLTPSSVPWHWVGGTRAGWGQGRGWWGLSQINPPPRACATSSWH